MRHAAAPDVAPGEQLGARGALDALQITWSMGKSEEFGGKFAIDDVDSMLIQWRFPKTGVLINGGLYMKMRGILMKICH